MSLKILRLKIKDRAKISSGSGEIGENLKHSNK